MTHILCCYQDPSNRAEVGRVRGSRGHGKGIMDGRQKSLRIDGCSGGGERERLASLRLRGQKAVPSSKCCDYKCDL